MNKENFEIQFPILSSLISRISKSSLQECMFKKLQCIFWTFSFPQIKKVYDVTRAYNRIDEFKTILLRMCAEVLKDYFSAS